MISTTNEIGTNAKPVVPDAPPCCDGLVSIAVADFEPATGMCFGRRGVFLCSACGDQVCDEWENPCNCPADCRLQDPNVCEEQGARCVGPDDAGGAARCPQGTGEVDLGGCDDMEVCCMPLQDNRCEQQGGSCMYPNAAGELPRCPDGSAEVDLPGCDRGGICCMGGADCVPDGGRVAVIPDAPRCCPGLERIPIAAYDEAQGMCMVADGAALCSSCGNGVCAEWENVCNCPRDCVEPEPNLCEREGAFCLDPDAAGQLPRCPPGTAEIDLGGCDRGSLCCMPLPGECEGAGGMCFMPEPDGAGPRCPDLLAEVDMPGCPEQAICCMPDAPCLLPGMHGPAIPNGPQCCPGVDMISIAIYDEQLRQCVDRVGGFLCSLCGDRMCDPWENRCNCPDDCGMAQP